MQNIQPKRYETELQILLLGSSARQRIIGTVDIPTIYIDGNRASHFRPIRDGLRIYRVMLFFPGIAAASPDPFNQKLYDVRLNPWSIPTMAKSVIGAQLYTLREHLADPAGDRQDLPARQADGL